MKLHKYCWLTQSWEKFNDKPEPFDYSHKDIDCFEKFYHLIFPQSEFCQEEIYSIANEYNTAINVDKDIYDFTLNSPNTKYKIHTRLQQDLPRSIGKIRNDKGVVFTSPINITSPSSSSIVRKSDPLIESFARMLIHADRNNVLYRQGYAEIILPIYHIFFAGISGISALPPDLYLVEGLTVKAFINFMLKEPFNHLKFFDTSNNELIYIMIELKKKLIKYELGEYIQKEDVNVSLFASRWFLLIFTQDLPLKDVILVWSHIIQSVSEARKFHSLLIDCCLTAAVLMTNHCKGKSETQMITVLQNISSLNGESISKEPPDVYLARKKKRNLLDVQRLPRS